jgi:hypothetical protein
MCEVRLVVKPDVFDIRIKMMKCATNITTGQAAALKKINLSAPLPADSA